MAFQMTHLGHRGRPVLRRQTTRFARKPVVKEKPLLENFIKNKKITHVRVSESLKPFEERFLQKYKLLPYDPSKDAKMNTLFFGFYNNNDLINIKNHTGNAFLMFGGTDLSTNFNRIPIYQKNLQFVCISDDNKINLKNFFHNKPVSFVDDNNFLMNMTNYNFINNFFNEISRKTKPKIYINHDIKNNTLIKTIVTSKLFDIVCNYDDGGLIFTNDINIIQKSGEDGKLVFTTKRCDFINAFYFDENTDWVTLKTFDFNIENYKKYIEKSTKLFLEKQPRTETVVYIPIWNRHKLLKKTIDSIKSQTKNCIILGICSNSKDYNFAKQNNIIPIATLNKPLGKKYQIGIELSKLFYPKNVIIMGSDDIMTANYVENINKFMDGHDVVGINYWKIHNVVNNKYYSLRYTHKLIDNYWGSKSQHYSYIYNVDINGFNINKCKQNPFTIGAGRSISHRILDTINWKVYVNKNKSLDTLSLFKLLVLNNASYLTLNKRDFYVTSLKDESEEMITGMDVIFKSKTMKICEDL